MEQFRQQLYQNFNKRADALIELVDALCSYPEANSVVELSLAACFRRGHASLYAAIADFKWEEEAMARLAAPYVTQPKQRPFWLLGADVTPQPRPFAPTLSDRGMVYQPNLVKGNKPVTIGHQYSTVGLFPEAEAGVSDSWIVPLSVERVATSDDKEMVGSRQIGRLLEDEKLPWHQELVVEVVDSSYSKKPYLCANRQHDNLVTICRVASNRTFYQKAKLVESPAPVGHPTWYGDVFRLPDPDTWHKPDEKASTAFVSRRGKEYNVETEVWRDMLMTGKQKPAVLPMQEHPFTLFRIVLVDPETGQPAFKRAMWLIVMGKRRDEVTLLAVYHAYRQRYNLEHFFRFGKQKFLLDNFQTPEEGHEEAWWQLAHLAYLQLWIARHLVACLPRPWERNLPAMKARLISPTLAQRGFGRVIHEFGTPAQSPKPRGNSSGWPLGKKRTRRTRHDVVVKGQKKENPP